MPPPGTRFVFVLAVLGVLASPAFALFIHRMHRKPRWGAISSWARLGVYALGLILGLVLMYLPGLTGDDYDVVGMPVPWFAAQRYQKHWFHGVFLLAIPVDLLYGFAFAHAIAWFLAAGRRPPR